MYAMSFLDDGPPIIACSEREIASWIHTTGEHISNLERRAYVGLLPPYARE